MQLSANRVDGWFPPGPLVASCLLYPSGPLRTTRPFLRLPIATPLPLHQIRKSGQHGLTTSLPAALGIRYVLHHRLNIV